MKRYSSYIVSAAAVALAALAACSQMTEEEFVAKGAQQQVKLAASTTTLTRAADGIYTDANGFAGGEKVEVFMNDGATHATYTLAAPADGAAAMTAPADGAIEYPADDADVTLYAIYPAASTAAHVVARDQTTAAGYQASDLMYATKTVGASEREATQNMLFQHKLVKLAVAVTKPADVSVLGGVTLHGVRRKVTVTPSASDLAVTAVEAAADGDAGYDADEALNNSISFGAVEAAATTEQTYTYACVLPETTWAADDDFLTVTLDGQHVTYKLGSAVTLEAGHAYTLTMTATPNGMQGSTATLAAWGALTEGTVEALTSKNALTIADIADQTWSSTGCEPTVTVSKNGTTLSAGTDYDVTYVDNKAVGTATVIVLGKGSYAGKGGTKTFNIVKKSDAAISYSTTSITDKKYGDAAFTNTLTNTGDGTVTYVSSVTEVATVNANTGEVTIVKPGTTTITATAETRASDNSEYATATASYTLEVAKAAGSVKLKGKASDASEVASLSGTVKSGAEGSFVVSSHHADGVLSVSVTSTGTGVTMSSGPTLSSDGANQVVKFTPTSSNSESNVTGTVITVKCAETDYYNEATATYNLTVSPAAGATPSSSDFSTKIMVLGVDGMIYVSTTSLDDAKMKATNAGTIPVAIVSYLGSDAGCEHGLAVALVEVAASATTMWGGYNNGTHFTSPSLATDAATAITDMNGKSNTSTLNVCATHTGTATGTSESYYHYPAKYCIEYKVDVSSHTGEKKVEVGAGSWFLASAGQWEKMRSANGKLFTATSSGGCGLSGSYWSSTELSAGYAWNVSSGGLTNSYKGYTYVKVRPVLAF